MKRVKASGVLMIFTTFSSGLGPWFFFNPIGYCCVMSVTTVQLIANSWLQIGSFAPAGGSTDGPLLALARLAHTRLKSHKQSDLEHEETRRIDALLLANVMRSPNLGTRRLQWPRRLSVGRAHHYMDRPSTTEAPAESEPSSPTRRRGGFLEAVSSSFGTNLFRRLSHAGAAGPDAFGVAAPVSL